MTIFAAHTKHRSMIRKILLFAFIPCCLIGKIHSQTVVSAKGIENILSQSKELALQSSQADTILAKRIDSLMHATYSDQQVFEIVFQTGTWLCNVNRREEAVKYMSYCLSVLKDTYPDLPRNSLVTYIHIMNQIGLAYNYMGLSDLSLNYYMKALDIARKSNHREEEAILCNNIASIFQAQKNFHKSDSLFKRAITINEELKVPQRLFVNYNNISVNYAKKSDYSKALEYAFLAMHQLDAVRDSDLIILMQRNIGSIYLKQKETGLALQLLKQVEEYQTKHHQDYYLIATYQIMHIAYKSLNRKEQAAEYLKRALTLSENYNNVLEKADLLTELSNHHANEKQYDKALTTLQRSISLKDSLYKTGEEKRTRSLSIAYDEELALQEKLIQAENVHEATMQRGYRISSCAVALLLILSGWGAYRLKKIKNKKRLLFINRIRQKEEQVELREEKIVCLLNNLENLKSELEQSKSKQLYYSLQDTKNKEFISQLTDHLKQLLLDINPKETQVKKKIREIISQLGMIDSSNVLQDFRDSFESVHHHFYENLSLKFPNLTMKEMRLCSLLRLGLSTKEIADITFKEVRSVESARNRLRKKLQIDHAEDLQKFLLNF